MFLQIKLAPEDRKYHRFLWRDLDETSPIEVYEYQRLVFGNTSSPYLAQDIVRAHATSFKDQFPLAAESVLNSMFVDDLMDSTATKEEN